MSVLDLTHTISGEMPVYPGTEKPVLTTACTIETAGYRETLLHMYSHTGTHMDAPAHMIARGRTLDSYGVEKFVGPGFVLDCRGRQEIPLALLRAHEEDIRRAEFLLFCTGWDRLWGKDGYYENFPCLTAEAARFVASLPLKGVGEDSISLDRLESVLRAGGDIAAAGGKEGRNGPLIKADHAQKDLLHASVNSPSSPRQRR